MLTTTRRRDHRHLLREGRGRYEVGPSGRVVRERSGAFDDGSGTRDDGRLLPQDSSPVEDASHPVHGVEPPPGEAFVDDTPPSPDDLAPPRSAPTPIVPPTGSPGSARRPAGVVAEAVRLLSSVDESRPGASGPSDGSQLTGLVATVRAMDLLAAAAVRLVGRLDGGQAVREEGMTVDAALRLHTGATRSDVSMLLTAAELLARMPVTADLFARGVFTWAHIRALTSGARAFDATTREALDRHLGQRAAHLQRLDGEGRLWAVDDAIALHTPTEALEDRAERDADTRSLVITPRLDGTGTIFTDLDVEGFATVTARLDAEASVPLAAASPGDDGSGLPRAVLDALPGSRSQLLTDALVRICAERPGGQGATPVRFTVIVDADLVTDRIAGILQPAVASRPPRIVRRAIDRLACDATVDVVVRDGTDLLAAHRYAPDVTAAVRRAVHARDGGCRFPGCRAPVTWCDVHHIVPRAVNGHHGVPNLVSLCRKHHVVVHRRGWRQHLDPDGAYQVSRNGRTWTTLPRRAASLLEPTGPPTTGDPPDATGPPGAGDPPGLRGVGPTTAAC